MAQSLVRSEPPDWLPGLVPQSVLRDAFEHCLPCLAPKVRREILCRVRKGKEVLATEWQRLLDDGVVLTRAELARRIGVSRARVTQVLGARTRAS